MSDDTGHIPTSLERMRNLPEGATLPNLSAEWFHVVSNILATMRIVMVVNQQHAEIYRTEDGAGWELRIPTGGGSGGSGYTGEKTRIEKVYLDGLLLKQDKVVDTYEDGLLKSSAAVVTETIITFEACEE